MKRFYFLAIVVCLMACNKEDEPTMKFRAEINGRPWTTDIIISPNHYHDGFKEYFDFGCPFGTDTLVVLQIIDILDTDEERISSRTYTGDDFGVWFEINRISQLTEILSNSIEVLEQNSTDYLLLANFEFSGVLQNGDTIVVRNGELALPPF